MIKSFDQYSSQFSSDPSNFLNKIGIATSENFNHSYFKVIQNKFDLMEAAIDFPIIITDTFNETTQVINESLTHKYNSSALPNQESVLESFKDLGYLPNEVDNIRNVKSLTFPITAIGKNFKDEHKSIGSLRKAERIYSKFRENPVARTRFKVLGFKGNPISVVEWINKFPLDVELTGFQYSKDLENICESINKKFNLDVYNVNIIESINGKIFVESIDRNLDLNPHESKLLYESIYRDFYKSRLPNWIKNKINEEYTKLYYKRKFYDSALIKSKHTLNYSKYL